MYNEYDEIKGLIKKSKLIFEQAIKSDQINIAKDIENSIDSDKYETYDDGSDNREGKEAKEDKVQRYRISGGILAIHGKDKTDLKITTDEKIAFQETMDEFVEQVSDLVDYNTLNLYKNSVEWSGDIIGVGVEFVFIVGEDSGIYLNGGIMKLDDNFTDTMNNLRTYYNVFKSRWSKILASRKKTKIDER